MTIDSPHGAELSAMEAHDRWGIFGTRGVSGQWPSSAESYICNEELFAQNPIRALEWM